MNWCHNHHLFRMNCIRSPFLHIFFSFFFWFVCLLNFTLYIFFFLHFKVFGLSCLFLSCCCCFFFIYRENIIIFLSFVVVVFFFSSNGINNGFTPATLVHTTAFNVLITVSKAKIVRNLRWKTKYTCNKNTNKPTNQQAAKLKAFVEIDGAAVCISKFYTLMQITDSIAKEMKKQRFILD